MKRLAVLFVHGVEITDPQYAETPARLLRAAFTRHLGRAAPDPRDALVVQAAQLAPVLDSQQRAFFARECKAGGTGAAGDQFHEQMARVVRRLTSGLSVAIAPLLAALLRRNDPTFPGVQLPTARWIMAHFVGDAIAYQITGSSREIYDRTHRAYAEALAALAEQAGPDAPLCVIAHSMGTVITSDFFYDRETERRTGVPAPPFRRAAPTPLERGETLTWLYTLGAPIALWSLRYPGASLTAPIAVPAPEMRGRAELGGEWVNVIDGDDIIAWPLAPLGPEYAKAVKDVHVRVKAALVRWTPFVHPFYWADRAVMAPIGQRLADAWLALQRSPKQAVRAVG